MAIRPKTEAKSAAPRSGAPKGELEQYGVWVKAEPQDIVEEAAPPASDFDFDIPVSPTSAADESFLSADEEKLLGSFDTDFEVPKEEPASEPDLSTLPSIDEMPTIETSLLDETPSAKSDEIEDLGSATLDISLEDIDGLHQVSSIRPDSEIDMSSVQGLDSDSVSPAPEMEDVSTEFLDVTPASGQVEDVTAEFLDAEPAKAPAAEPAPEFESLDIDLHFDDTIPQGETAPSSSSLPGFEEVTEFDDFLAKDEGKPQAAEEPQSFDDLAAVERDLTEPPPSAAARETPAPRPSSSDLSTEILLKIAEELSSIRGELISLKTQLGDLRREAEAGATAEPQPPKAEAEESHAGGFFDEEEDETIALTGDELDNILNTADFTEESAEAEAEAPADIVPSEQALPESGILSETILPESGDYSAAPADLPAIEEISLAADGSVETSAAKEPSAEAVPEFGEIGLLAEEGVVPMTAAPEDTSYLEAEGDEAPAETLVEESAVEVSGFGDLGMENVPLVEPDLSQFEAEELEAEPVVEIEEELPLVEEAEPLEPDLTFQTIPEAEPVEAATEPDHSHFTGIDLHQEAQAPLPEMEEILEVEEIPEVAEPALQESAARLTPSEEIAADKAAEPLPPLEDNLASEEAEAAPVAESLVEEAPAVEMAAPEVEEAKPLDDSERLKTEIRSVLAYLDKLLDSLPEDKIEEFARSEHFDTYKRLFEELGLV